MTDWLQSQQPLEKHTLALFSEVKYHTRDKILFTFSSGWLVEVHYVSIYPKLHYSNLVSKRLF